MGAGTSVMRQIPPSEQLVELKAAMDKAVALEDGESLKVMEAAFSRVSGNQEGKIGQEEDVEVKKIRNLEFLYACGAYRPKVGVKSNLTECTNLHSKGVNLEFKDDDQWTALHHAAGEGLLKIVEFLVLEAGAAIDPVDEFNCTPLWVACCNDRRDVVKFLLMSGASTDISGKPPGEPEQKPALAARRNRHPGLGDLVDAEAELRLADSPARLNKQLAHKMDMQEFNDSMRGTLKAVAPM